MSYMFLHYIGGLIYWIFVKFCKTKLESEQANKHIERNIIVLLIAVFIIAFITIKIL